MNWRNGMTALAAIALAAVAMPASAAHVYYEAEASVESATPVQPYLYSPGHWESRGGMHVWVDGPYAVEHPGAYWVPGRWLQQSDGNWLFIEGHWEG
jgi:hypothetical protein